MTTYYPFPKLIQTPTSGEQLRGLCSCSLVDDLPQSADSDGAVLINVTDPQMAKVKTPIWLAVNGKSTFGLAHKAYTKYSDDAPTVNLQGTMRIGQSTVSDDPPFAMPKAGPDLAVEGKVGVGYRLWDGPAYDANAPQLSVLESAAIGYDFTHLERGEKKNGDPRTATLSVRGPLSVTSGTGSDTQDSAAVRARYPDLDACAIEADGNVYVRGEGLFFRGSNNMHSEHGKGILNDDFPITVYIAPNPVEEVPSPRAWTPIKHDPVELDPLAPETAAGGVQDPKNPHKKPALPPEPGAPRHKERITKPDDDSLSLQRLSITPAFCTFNGLLAQVEVGQYTWEQEQGTRKATEAVLRSVFDPDERDTHAAGKYIASGDLTGLVRKNHGTDFPYDGLYGTRMSWGGDFLMIGLVDMEEVPPPVKIDIAAEKARLKTMKRSPERTALAAQIRTAARMERAIARRAETDIGVEDPPDPKTGKKGKKKKIPQLVSPKGDWQYKPGPRKDTVLAWGDSLNNRFRLRYIGAEKINLFQEDIASPKTKWRPRDMPPNLSDEKKAAWTKKEEARRAKWENSMLKRRERIQRSAEVAITKRGGDWPHDPEQTNYHDVMVIDPDGSIVVNGTLYAVRTVRRSDARQKERVRPIRGALEKVLALRGVTFAWKPEAKGAETIAERQYGMIAQEVSAECPEAVSVGTDDLLGIDYDQITPLLVEAVKEQQRTIAEQRERLSKLEEALSASLGDDGVTIARGRAPERRSEARAAVPRTDRPAAGARRSP